MLVVPPLSGVTVKVADEAPSAKTTWVFDREITDVSKPVRFTVNPPAGAGVLKARVKVPVTPGTLIRFNGLGVRRIFFDPAEMVTVDGSLLANPSLTISCAI